MVPVWHPAHERYLKTHVKLKTTMKTAEVLVLDRDDFEKADELKRKTFIKNIYVIARVNVLYFDNTILR